MKVFIHIPKTAGVMVRELLSADLHSKEILHVSDPAGFDADAELAPDIKLVHGHFDISMADKLAVPGAQLFTFLRDPLERSISEYYFIKDGNYTAEELPSAQVKFIQTIKSLTLEEFLLSQEPGVRGRVQNAQLFYLSGDVFNSQHTLEQRYLTACEVIDRCFYLGIVEQMDKSLELLACKLELPPQASVVRNSAARGKQKLSLSVVEEFKVRNYYEYKIYAYAEKKMEAKHKEITRELIFDRFIKGLEKQPPLQGLNYTFDQPLAGDGWHTREHDGALYWRFTGPADIATLYFPRINISGFVLKLQVFHAVTSAHLDNMTVSYNEVELLLCGREGNLLIFRIPVEAVSGSLYTRIKIMTPPAMMPEQGDDRLLGVGFSRVEIL